MKRWVPITCDCDIRLTDEQALSSFASKCAAHAGLTRDQAWSAIFASGPLAECPRWLAVYGGIMASEDLGIAEDGPTGQRQLRDGYTFSLTFTGTGADRVLEVRVGGSALDHGQQAALDGIVADVLALDPIGGAGKVAIV